MDWWGQAVNVVAVPTDPNNTDISTLDTLQKMIVVSSQSATSPAVLRVVEQCCIESGAHKGSDRDVARTIYLWIKNHVRFVEDEEVLGTVLGYRNVQHELLVSPPVLLSMPIPSGDCDDFSMLAASLLLAAGMQVRFVVIACDEKEPWRFSHVYCEVYLSSEGRWVGFDSSHGRLLGWEYHGQVYRRYECEV